MVVDSRKGLLFFPLGRKGDERSLIEAMVIRTRMHKEDGVKFKTVEVRLSELMELVELVKGANVEKIKKD